MKWPDVVEAHTVFVLVDPDAGIAVEHPNANRIARDDVEKALMKWGRYSLVIEPSTADLIISVRKGSGKIAQPTIGGVSQNNDIGVIQPTDSGAGLAPGREIREFPASLAPKWRSGSHRTCLWFIATTGKIRPDPRSTLRQCGDIAGQTRLHLRRFRRSLCSAR